MRALRRWCVVGLAFTAGSIVVWALTLSTTAEALGKLFPGVSPIRQTVFLTDAQKAEIEKRAGEALPSAIVYPYEIHQEGELKAVVYFDRHRVRTLPETVLVAVSGQHELIALETLEFHEPKEYLAPKKWLEQFKGMRAIEELKPGRGIDGITGATLTTRAITGCARRVLAMHEVLYPKKTTE